MTVSSIIPVNTYAGNFSNTKFDFDFLIEDENELTVEYINENGVTTKLTLGEDYSINEVGNKNGSYITFPLSDSKYEILKENEKINLILSLSIKQESEFKNSSYFKLDVLEWTFDYIVRILQILNRKIERCVKVGEGVSVTPDEMLNDIETSKNTVISHSQYVTEVAMKVEAQSDNLDVKLENFNDTYENCYQSIVNTNINTRADINLSNITETAKDIIKEQMLEDLNGKADVDLSNVNPSQTFKENSVSWGMPDYYAGIALSIGNQFTAPCDGIFKMYGYSASGSLVLYASIYDEEGNYLFDIGAQNGSTSNSKRFTVIYPIPKGYKITVGDIYPTNATTIFYPFKGVNQ